MAKLWYINLRVKRVNHQMNNSNSTFWKGFTLGIISGISFTVTFAALTFFFDVNTAGATYRKEEKYERCEPTPTLRPTTTPIPTITPTPETPATPSATPTAPSTPQPESRESGQHVPTCRDGAVLQLPANLHVIRNMDVAEVKWFPTGGSQVNLFYKENVSKGWTHAVPDELNDGYVKISNLNPRESYTFGLEQKNGCNGGTTVMGVVIDPPASTPTLFKMNYWVWN